MSSSATTIPVFTDPVDGATNAPSVLTTIHDSIRSVVNDAFNTTAATGHTHNGTDAAHIAAQIEDLTMPEYTEAMLMGAYR